MYVLSEFVSVLSVPSCWRFSLSQRWCKEDRAWWSRQLHKDGWAETEHLSSELSQLCYFRKYSHPWWNLLSFFPVYIFFLNDHSSILIDILCVFPATEEEYSLSLAKDNSHNSSFELQGSMLPSYQPVNCSTTGGRGLSARTVRSPSPCFFRPSFLGSASKVRHWQFRRVDDMYD